LFLLVAVWEVLDVQVASLLRVLVSDGLSQLLNLALSLLQGITDDKVYLLVTVDQLLVVESLNGLLSALRTVLLVDALRIVVADESELSDLTGLDDQREDVAVRLEHALDVILSVRVWNVLNVNVVHELAKLALVVLRLELNNFHAVERLAVESSSGRLRVLIADEAIATRLVVRVQRDLERLDWAELLEMLVHVLVLHFLGNGSDENVVGEELLLVGTKELSVEWEGTAWLAFDLEVAHLVTSVLELIGILDADHGTVERLGDIVLDLGLLGVDECDTGLVLKDLSELD
jgi:hypothetical protein